jgi:uncharacterized protein (TIGR02466 family)
MDGQPEPTAAESAPQVSTKLEYPFAVPIFTATINEPAALNARILEEARAMREQSPGVQRSNRNGWHSETDLFNRTEPGLKALCQFIVRSVNTVTRRMNPQFDFKAHAMRSNGWININPPGGYNAPHRHDGFQWSGCYYVNQPEVEEGNSGMIEFISPCPGGAEQASLGIAPFRQKYRTRPAPGELLIFPSNIMHWVFPNEAEGERVSIAFNASYVVKPPS